MSLEAGTFLLDVVATNPTVNDPVSQGDDHLRLLKAVLRTTFPNSSKPLYFPTVSVSKVFADTPVAVATTDQEVLFLANAVAGAITFNLPAAASAGNGFRVGFKKTDASVNAVTLDGNGAETLDGALTATITKINRTIWLRSDGVNWQIDTRTGYGALADLDTVAAAQISALAVVTAALADGAVTLPKMEAGTIGQTLYYGTAGAATRLNAGTLGFKLTAQGAAAPLWAADIFGGQLLHVRDQRASGTLSGTFTSGAWRTRTLQTVLTNEIASASLAANQISLPAGTYYIEAFALGLKTDANQAKLRNITDSTDTVIGSSGRTNSGADENSRSTVAGRFTIAGTKVFELQHQCATTSPNNGFGGAASFGVAEVYAEVCIWKVA